MSGRTRCVWFASWIAAMLLVGCTFSPELERAQQAGAFTPSGRSGTSARQLRTEVLATFPHDRNAFTQGLVLHEGALLESTGRYFHSTLRRVDLASGSVTQQVSLSGLQFGEGLALVRDQLVQLTWQNGVALVYDARTFANVKSFRYSGEGWGLCFDGTTLAMSDGTNRLVFRDPGTFEIVREVPVTLDGQQVSLLNELECVGDSVYANIWRADTIVEISSRDGVVRAVIDAAGLLTPDEAAGLPAEAVLNGIAHEAETGTFLLTGKLWPKLFRVRFVDPSAPPTPRARRAT